MPQSLFPPRRAPLVNYDWIDLASGTGYVLYDGLRNIAPVAANDTYVLIDSSKASSIAGIPDSNQPRKLFVTRINGNSGTSGDLDFDLTQFQFPQTIEGQMFVRISIESLAAAVGGLIVTIKLRKWDGSTETEIANVVSEQEGININTTHARTMIVTVPRTHYKKGETLRITVEVSTTDADEYGIAHDPRDLSFENFSAGDSRFVVAVPYRINL